MSEMDEKDRKAAQTIFNTLCSALDDIEYHYKKDEDELEVRYDVQGDDLPMDFTISVFGDRDVIRLLSFLPFKVAEERLPDITMAICWINDHLLNGSFDITLERGQITFRMTQSYRDSLIDIELFKYMIFVSINTVDEYNDRLFMVSQGKMTMEELQAAEDQ